MTKIRLELYFILKETLKEYENGYKIRATKLTTRKNKSGRQARYPIAEQKMHEDFKRLWEKGKSFKRYWFKQRMRQLIWEHYADSIEKFRNSDQWFARFCRRFKVSLKRKTHTAKKTLSQVAIIRKFHKHLFWVRKKGKYEFADIANMDQTGSFLTIDDGKTYETANSKGVWCKSGTLIKLFTNVNKVRSIRYSGVHLSDMHQF